MAAGAAVAAAAGFGFTGFRLTPSPSTGIDHRILGDDRALESLRQVLSTFQGAAHT